MSTLTTNNSGAMSLIGGILTLIAALITAFTQLFMPSIKSYIAKIDNRKSQGIVQSVNAAKIHLDVDTQVVVIVDDLNVRYAPNKCKVPITILLNGKTGVVKKTKPPEGVAIHPQYEWRFIRWCDGTKGWSAIRDKVNGKDYIIKKCE